LRRRFGKTNLFILFLALIISLLSAGCVYRLKLDRSYPLNGTLKDFQPLAVLPIRDAAGYPESGVILYLSVQRFLAQKGYTLVNPSAVARTMAELNLTPENLLSDPPALANASKLMKARLLVEGTILEYSFQKSYVSSQDFQVWDGPVYQYRTLPTYHQGTCQMRLRLRMLDPEKGSSVWLAEGSSSGPSSSAEFLKEKLVERLLESFPSL
jgi:hypothetical protein